MDRRSPRAPPAAGRTSRPPADPGRRPRHRSVTVSVVICAYTEERWDDLVAAVDSAWAQTVEPHEVIVVVDHNPALLERVRQEFPRATAVENAAARGLSGARNSGVQVATGDIVAFLDDDALAAPDWLKWLV